MTSPNRKRLSLSVQIGLGLLAGLLLGIAASVSGRPWLAKLAIGVEPAGTIWINLIRMVVIPLVVAALVSGVANLGDVRRLGRLGARTLGFYFGSELLGALLGLALGLAVIPLAPLSQEVTGSLRATAAAGAREVTQQAQQVHGIGQFILDLVPTNPVRAAADGALLPLIVFSVLFGAAVASLEERPRKLLVELADSVVAALIRLIGWIMLLAPIGVACLAAPLAARFGWNMLGSLAVFVVAVAVGCVLFALAVYAPAARLWAGVRLGPFSRTIAPASTVGFTTTSSMAALPTMLDIAIGKLGISSPVASFVLPIGATLNRPGTAIYHTIAAVFIAALYGVHLDPARLAVIVTSTFLATFLVVAVPSATVFALSPTLLAAGLPLEGIALLLGVDRIPDMFRTGLNVTGDMAAVAVVARAEGEAGEALT